LVQGAHRKFYGTTAGGGANNLGTGFELSVSGSTGTLVWSDSFDNPSGWEPEGQLLQATQGNFYGTTVRGGANTEGEIFEVTSTGTLTVFHDFDSTDGDEPVAGLIQATDGNFYGTTYAGGNGPGQTGAIFRIGLAGKLNNFSFDGTDGSYPYGGRLRYTSGAFFGTTSSGGTSTACIGGCGTMFTASVGLGQFVKLPPASGAAGATITILGDRLTGATAVSFNGTPPHRSAWLVMVSRLPRPSLRVQPAARFRSSYRREPRLKAT
jgi:uncharacterized repeat protein (TIGR03803 family)